MIRVVDTFYLRVPKELPEGANPVISLTALLSFKRGDEPDANKHPMKLKIQGPTGSLQDLPTVMEIFFKPGEVASANLIVNIQLGVKASGPFGRYRLDVFMDDEMVTQIPFMLLEQPEPKSPEAIQ